MRTVVSMFVVSAVALGSIIGGASAAATWSASAAGGPQQKVTASLVKRPSGTLAPGTAVPASGIYGSRVFIDTNRGYALVQDGQAQYPAATTDGGKTWKTIGLALHVNAAQAPLAVAFVGAGGTKKIFAWGGGQVIDATPDGGAHWYRATFTGLPVAVRNERVTLGAVYEAALGRNRAADERVMSLQHLRPPGTQPGGKHGRPLDICEQHGNRALRRTGRILHASSLTPASTHQTATPTKAELGHYDAPSLLKTVPSESLRRPDRPLAGFRIRQERRSSDGSSMLTERRCGASSPHDARGPQLSRALSEPCARAASYVDAVAPVASP
jgi:hypothetical protein